jgi:rhodanese-related sulfurtransferase
MIEQLTPSAYLAWLQVQPAHNVPPLLIDVREGWEFEAAQVKPQGFDVVHWPMQTVPQEMASIDPERPVALLCHHGSRSMAVANYLEQQGFKTLINIQGGIHAWSIEIDQQIAQY